MTSCTAYSRNPPLSVTGKTPTAGEINSKTTPKLAETSAGQLAFDAAHSFVPWPRSGRYTFLLASPHIPWGGSTLAVHDAESDRSRILLDATTDPLLGTILIHDVQESAVLVSVTTGSPYDGVARPVLFFVLDVERGLGGPLLVHVEETPSTPVPPARLDGDQRDRSATPGCGRARLVRATGAAQVSRGVQCAERLNAAGVMSGTSSPKTSRCVPSRSKAHAR